jgi:hypothetical protein
VLTRLKANFDCETTFCEKVCVSERSAFWLKANEPVLNPW